MIWDFNKLFWRHLGEWEAASGRGFEAALPTGQSDANRPDAVNDSVVEFWKLLKELEAKGQLAAEFPILEIGVGAGTRAAAWIDGFKAYDDAAGHEVLRPAAVHPRRLLARHARARVRVARRGTRRTSFRLRSTRSTRSRRCRSTGSR